MKNIRQFILLTSLVVRLGARDAASVPGRQDASSPVEFVLTNSGSRMFLRAVMGPVPSREPSDLAKQKKLEESPQLPLLVETFFPPVSVTLDRSYFTAHAEQSLLPGCFVAVEVAHCEEWAARKKSSARDVYHLWKPILGSEAVSRVPVTVEAVELVGKGGFSRLEMITDEQGRVTVPLALFYRAARRTANLSRLTLRFTIRGQKAKLECTILRDELMRQAQRLGL